MFDKSEDTAGLLARIRRSSSLYEEARKRSREAAVRRAKKRLGINSSRPQGKHEWYWEVPSRIYDSALDHEFSPESQIRP